MTVEVDALSELLKQTLPLDDLLERIRALYASMHGDPGIAILAVEFQLLATRSPTVRRSYNALWSRHRAALSDLIVVAAGRLGLQLRTPPPDLVDALAALMRGLVLRDAIARLKGAKSAQDVLIDFLRNELSYVASNPAARAANILRRQRLFSSLAVVFHLPWLVRIMVPERIGPLSLRSLLAARVVAVAILIPRTMTSLTTPRMCRRGVIWICPADHQSHAARQTQLRRRLRSNKRQKNAFRIRLLNCGSACSRSAHEEFVQGVRFEAQVAPLRYVSATNARWRAAGRQLRVRLARL
jgi:hypothetical protein